MPSYVSLNKDGSRSEIAAQCSLYSNDVNYRPRLNLHIAFFMQLISNLQKRKDML